MCPTLGRRAGITRDQVQLSPCRHRREPVRDGWLAIRRKRVLADAVELMEVTLDCTRALDPNLLEMAEHALSITAGQLGR